MFAHENTYENERLPYRLSYTEYSSMRIFINLLSLTSVLASISFDVYIQTRLEILILKNTTEY